MPRPMPRKCDGVCLGPLLRWIQGLTLRIHIPANYPPETLVLFVMSTWHVLVALLISRVGVLRSAPLAMEDASPLLAQSQSSAAV